MASSIVRLIIVIGFPSPLAFAVSIMEHLLGAETIECHPHPLNFDTVLSFRQPSILQHLPQSQITSFMVISTPVNAGPESMGVIEYEYQDTLQDDHYRINLTSLPDEIQRTWKHEEAEFLIAMTINVSTVTETRQIQSQSPVFFIQNASVVRENAIDFRWPPLAGDAEINYEVSLSDRYKDDRFELYWRVLRYTDFSHYFHGYFPALR
eukprot:318102_1